MQGIALKCELKSAFLSHNDCETVKVNFTPRGSFDPRVQGFHLGEGGPAQIAFVGTGLICGTEVGNPLGFADQPPTAGGISEASRDWNGTYVY